METSFDDKILETVYGTCQDVFGKLGFWINLKLKISGTFVEVLSSALGFTASHRFSLTSLDFVTVIVSIWKTFERIHIKNT